MNKVVIGLLLSAAASAQSEGKGGRQLTEMQGI